MSISVPYKHLDRVVLPIGKKTFIVDVKNANDISAQWQNRAADGSTTITVYSTDESDLSRLLDSTGIALDPDANPDWFELPVQFTSQPTGVIATSIYPIQADAHCFLAFDLVTTVQHSNFSFFTNCKRRSV